MQSTILGATSPELTVGRRRRHPPWVAELPRRDRKDDLVCARTAFTREENCGDESRDEVKIQWNEEFAYHPDKI